MLIITCYGDVRIDDPVTLIGSRYGVRTSLEGDKVFGQVYSVVDQVAAVRVQDVLKFKWSGLIPVVGYGIVGGGTLGSVQAPSKGLPGTGTVLAVEEDIVEVLI